MKAIDQYYEIARSELLLLSQEAAAAADSMANKLDTDPSNRPLPIGTSDMSQRLRTVERMIARFTLLCELKSGKV